MSCHIGQPESCEGKESDMAPECFASIGVLQHLSKGVFVDGGAPPSHAGGLTVPLQEARKRLAEQPKARHFLELSLQNLETLPDQ